MYLWYKTYKFINYCILLPIDCIVYMKIGHTNGIRMEVKICKTVE